MLRLRRIVTFAFTEAREARECADEVDADADERIAPLCPCPRNLAVLRAVLRREEGEALEREHAAMFEV